MTDRISDDGDSSIHEERKILYYMYGPQRWFRDALQSHAAILAQSASMNNNVLRSSDPLRFPSLGNAPLPLPE